MVDLMLKQFCRPKFNLIISIIDELVVEAPHDLVMNLISLSLSRRKKHGAPYNPLASGLVHFLEYLQADQFSL